MMEVTWEGVGRVCKRAPVVLFQMLIVASLVPPPEARREGCHGHQAMAFGTHVRPYPMKTWCLTFTAAV